MSSAEEIFWELPELVQNLLPYLDVYSIASLSSIHQPTIRILKEDWGDSFMSKRIKESELPCNLQLNEETLEQNRIGLHRLAKLLIKMKNQMIQIQADFVEGTCKPTLERSLPSEPPCAVSIEMM